MGKNRNKEISTALYRRLEPLLPAVKPSPKDGRPRLSDDLALNGNRHDSVVFEELVDALPTVGGKAGRLRQSLTNGQSDFYIQYFDPDSRTLRKNYPDCLFLRELSDGTDTLFFCDISMSDTRLRQSRLLHKL
ncbi:hypothetical protein [Acidovorax carolinensis]|uniref:hypothetical protein n=1 Tax=Acidovorax carolinensis TaxID=553814 RepID=UPI000B349ACD|nr:hypothetical protein [Acidovorax carolinensis]ART48089.1 hypothetical protein CBP33_08080 [Acidovorax carolinensis]